MKDSEEYRYSEATAYKQESLRRVLNVNMSINAAIWKKHSHWVKPLLYIDLHSGPGTTHEGENGSPMIFASCACNILQAKAPHHIHFYERDNELFAQLNENLQKKYGKLWTRYTTHNTDHNLMDILPHEPDGTVYGAIYADPSNAQLPLALLRRISTLLPRLDIVLYIAATSLKRTRNLPTFTELREQIRTLNKDNWFLRDPRTAFQWTMFVGTNWTDYPGKDPSGGFHALQETDGQELLDRLSLTAEQLKQKYQKPLFGGEDANPISE